jgi:RNA polymerase sigma-70 factor, ECF subfamily
VVGQTLKTANEEIVAASDLGPDTIVPPSLLETVQERWQGLPVDSEAFLRYSMKRRVALSTLSKEIGADFYLAFACSHQLASSIETFHRMYGGRIAAIGRRFGESQSFADELLQRVFEKLFVPRSEQEEPGIAQYRAEAPLSAWVNTVARRIAFRQVKSARPERLLDDELLAQEISDVCDQELLLLREQHRDVVRDALACALRRMPAREQRFLKMNLVAGVSMDRIGKIYGISQSSVSRKIQRAILNVISEAKAEACEKLRISTGEVDSIFKLIQSCIDLTLSNFGEGSTTIGPLSPVESLQTES